MRDFLRRRAERRAAYKKMRGTELEPERCSGRTLGIAFEAIGAALRNPKHKVYFKDHDTSKYADTQLLTEIVELIATVGLEGFEWNHVEMWLSFNPDKSP